MNTRTTRKTIPGNVDLTTMEIFDVTHLKLSVCVLATELRCEGVALGVFSGITAKTEAIYCHSRVKCNLF